MPDSTIIVRPSEVDLRVSTVRIEDFPNTGTYLTIEKISAKAVHIEGQKGTSVNVRMAGKSYRISMTVIKFSPSDRYLFRAGQLLGESDVVLGVTLNFNGMKYVSGSADMETEPTRELAGDSSPFVTYALVGSFPIVKPGIFANPEVATAAQINSFGA